MSKTAEPKTYMPDLDFAAREAAGKLAVAIRLIDAREDCHIGEEDSDGWDLSIVRDLLIDIQTMLRGCAEAARVQRDGGAR